MVVSKKEIDHIAYLYFRIGTPIRAYEKPMLYAMTFDPKLAKKFEKSRNMDYFVKQEYYVEKPVQFMDRYKRHKIRICGFETKSEDPLRKKEVIVYLPCTYEEEEQVFLQTDYVFYELGKTIAPAYSAIRGLRPDMKFVLDLLGLDKILRFYNCITADSEGKYPEMSIEEKLFSGFDGFATIDDYNMKIDQLGLFIYYFGDTLNKEIKGCK